MRTVSELAELAGVTVRTLHHYDAIGLLVPSARSRAGYRLYDHEDLLRLQQIVFWRALGFGLDRIAAALDDAGYDRIEALRQQRAVLAERVDHLGAMLKAVDEALVEAEGGTPVEEEEMFVGFDNRQYEDEVRERWGDAAWDDSMQRWGSLGEAGQARLMADSEAFVQRLAEAFTARTPARSEAAMDLAEEARQSIDRHFYDCSREMHAALGEMYVADPRFAATYDQHAEGLAAWFRDAIAANAAR